MIIIHSCNSWDCCLIWNVLSRFSDRLDVSECINHKWLKEPTKEIILAVQTTTVANPEELKECTKPQEQTDDEVSSSSEEDKENSIHLPNNNNSPPVGAKLVLEKSLSISLFPDAPTTPKVCRKMLYDDDLKEIVKKYQTCESPQQKLAPPCCDDETSNDCLLCHKKIPSSKPSPLEIDFDKGIICWTCTNLFLLHEAFFDAPRVVTECGSIR